MSGMEHAEKEKDATRAEKAERRRKLANATELKRQTFYALENIRKAQLPAKIIGILLFALIVANAVIVFIFAEPSLDSRIAGAISVFYTFSTVCFFLEYLARIWIADLSYGSRTPARARIKYIFSPLGIIDLLSFFPNVIAWFVPMTTALRSFINLIRLVRLVKISRYMRGLRTIGYVIMKSRHEVIAAFLVLVLLVVLSSVLMYEIEHPAQPDKFNSLLSGLYWAVTTITATGYGDLVPITTAGRIVGSLIMFLSVALVAIPGGIFSAGFVAEFQNTRNRKIERDIYQNDDDNKDQSNQETKND